MPQTVGVTVVAVFAGLAACAGCNFTAEESPAEAPPRVGIDVWSKHDAANTRLAALMQPRTAAGEVFVSSLSDEVKQIADKLKQTAQLDPRLFLLLMRDGSTEGFPAYDARLGITHEEYDRLLYGSHLQLKKTSDVQLAIAHVEEERYRIRGLPTLAELTVDASLLLVATPYGEVTRPELQTQAAPVELTGPLVGYRWTEPPMTGDLRRYGIQELTLGQSPVDGAVWLIARIVDLVENRVLVDYYVRFTGPQE